jgi:glycerol-3-phosphate acyltransferase PlsY
LKHFDYPVIVMLGGAAVVLGHIFPVFLKFRGGKGVAAFAGVLLAFSIPALFIFVCAFLLTVLFTRYVSAGSLMGVASAFFFILFTQVMEISMIIFGIMVIIMFSHRSNLKKIFSGTENKLNLTKNG